MKGKKSKVGRWGRAPTDNSAKVKRTAKNFGVERAGFRSSVGTIQLVDRAPATK